MTLPGVTVDGCTVTPKAILRSESAARLMLEVVGAEHISGTDSGAPLPSRLHVLADGQPSGTVDTVPAINGVVHGDLTLMNYVGEEGDPSGANSFIDFCVNPALTSVSLYVCMAEGGAEVLQIPLPQAAIPEAEVSLPPEATVHFDFPIRGTSADCTLQSVKITPFYVELTAICVGDVPPETYDMNYANQERVRIRPLFHLYDAQGTEIIVGNDGAGGGPSPGRFTLCLATYDLIDPAQVATIEFNGVRYPAK